MSKIKGDLGYRDGWCIHYRSQSQGLGRPDLETCEAGIRFTDLGRPWPCFLTKGESRPDAAPCEKLRKPTRDEINAHEQWSKERREVMIKVMTGIMPWRAANKGKSARESVECPACRGKLHLSISSYNGHVHGHCETEGCVSWME